MHIVLTKPELIEYWNNKSCVVSGEQIELELRTSWKKERIEEEIKLFCDRVFNHISDLIKDDSYWQALETEKKKELLRSYLTTPFRGGESRNWCVDEITHAFLLEIKQSPTPQQSLALESLNYFERGGREANRCREEKLQGFCYVDPLTGDRYLTDGTQYLNAFQIAPDGTTKEKTMPFRRDVKIEQIESYFVKDNTGVRIQFSPGIQLFPRLWVHVFPALNTIIHGFPYPYSTEIILIVDFRKTMQGDVEGCFQGWAVSEVSISFAGSRRVSLEEAIRLTNGHLITIDIARDFNNFMRSPKSWLEQH